MIQKLFSIAYLPPIDFLLEMKNADSIWIEAHENYQKQTYRNRTTILTGNGLQDLIIPVVHHFHTKIKEIQIDNSVAWQRLHWRTIESAYNNSPYFLFYRDFFETIFLKKQNFLFDFNIELLQLMKKIFSLTNTVSLTDNYEKMVKNMADFREYFLPKNRTFRPKTIIYHQVFADRYSFVENLAWIDYLFTTGTDF
jgi:hypothetical protein